MKKFPDALGSVINWAAVPEDDRLSDLISATKSDPANSSLWYDIGILLSEPGFEGISAAAFLIGSMCDPTEIANACSASAGFNQSGSPLLAAVSMELAASLAVNTVEVDPAEFDEESVGSPGEIYLFACENYLDAIPGCTEARLAAHLPRRARLLLKRAREVGCDEEHAAEIEQRIG
jgi:hypothetical protein